MCGRHSGKFWETAVNKIERVLVSRNLYVRNSVSGAVERCKYKLICVCPYIDISGDGLPQMRKY